MSFDILTKGIGKEFNVEESDSNFTIADHDKFDSLVAKVRDEVVTDEYMKVTDKWAIMDGERIKWEISILTSDKCVVWIDVNDPLRECIIKRLREISNDGVVNIQVF